MPKIVMMPSSKPIQLTRFRNMSGSNMAVKKPIAEKQTSATDTFAYFIDP